MMYHLFFLNKRSLRGRTGQCAGDIKRICVDNGLRHEIIITSSIFDLKDSVMGFESHEDAVYYAVGGDGTFQVLANIVNLENAVLQYLPYYRRIGLRFYFPTCNISRLLHGG